MEELFFCLERCLGIVVKCVGSWVKINGGRNLVLPFSVLQSWGNNWNTFLSFLICKLGMSENCCKDYMREYIIMYLELCWGHFPGGPVVKTPCSQCRGPGYIPGQGTTKEYMPQLRSWHAPAKDPVQPKNNNNNNIYIFKRDVLGT